MKNLTPHTLGDLSRNAGRLEVICRAPVLRQRHTLAFAGIIDFAIFLANKTRVS
jgi:hypothetical protein